jgi:hypothetical protein
MQITKKKKLVEELNKIVNKKYLIIVILFYSIFSCVLFEARSNCIQGNCQDGQGNAGYSDGSEYKGDFKNGKREGRGKIVYYNGDIYEGTFNDGRANGEGTYTKKNGDNYVGSFRDGKPDGYGQEK